MKRLIAGVAVAVVLCGGAYTAQAVEDHRAAVALAQAEAEQEAKIKAAEAAQEKHRQEVIAHHTAYVASLSTMQGTLIGHFTTSLVGDNPDGRVHNIQLACQKINGKILMPNEEFSFNETTGDSNQPSAGWELATVIVGHQLTQGYGGGICQVSTTLCNAIINAGLQIDQRYHHSLSVGYVPAGEDATVSYPELDFSFTNNQPVPVKLQTQVVGNQVIANVYKMPPEVLN